MKLLVVASTACLSQVADAHIGPKTTTTLIPRSQTENNIKGSSLELTHWVYTYNSEEEEDVGVAEINFDTTLTMREVDDKSTIYWCALILKLAGTQTSYDCGVCKHELDRSLDKVKSPNEEQLAEMKTRWSIHDSWFKNTDPTVKDPSVYQLLQDSVDEQEDWAWREEMDYITELVPDTSIVTLRCPTYRLMNTQDYDDMKLEITLFYKVQGFYFI